MLHELSFLKKKKKIELILRFSVTLTYGEILRWSYILYELGHYWLRQLVTSILN